MKFFCSLLIFALINFSRSGEIRDLYTVIKIYETEAEPIFLIKNERNTGLIVSTNDTLEVDASFSKITIGTKYLFILNERKFRGETSGYMIIDESGKTEKRWDVKKDGEMPSIYKAKNVKGLYIKVPE
ncbi:hypothetical protein HYN59_03380 [Flavobacterium album]|uniref:Uncharacterized protein n=2 Tax=Flavobacterium album TaxID=2175091 RepID=A0A2S1QUX6_9FLAO|nr:hypothetical protein HYN59_03380 [Flavobacterium album]